MVDTMSTIPNSDLDFSLRCLRVTFYTLEGGLYVIYQSNKVNDYRTLPSFQEGPSLLESTREPGTHWVWTAFLLLDPPTG